MAESIIGNLPNSIEGFSNNILAYAMVLAAVATITMTFLELAKAAGRARYFFHKRELNLWITEREVYKQLIRLAAGGEKRAEAFFDQPTDKMMGQIQSAVNIAIDYPAEFPSLYSFIAGEVILRDSERNPFESRLESSDATVWYFYTLNTRARKDEPGDEQVQLATKARARIDHFASRKLDAFQTWTEFRWARLNQFLSVGLSAGFLIYFLIIDLKVPLIPGLVLSAFGGMMAPLAKDVVSALSGLRAK
ncbi:MAG: hypothetical protein V4594_08375 [Bacteroidota bacterium]